MGRVTQFTDGDMSFEDKIKLDGIDAEATANDSDAELRDRATHTGTQAISTVSGLTAALAGKQPINTNLTRISSITGEGALVRDSLGNITAQVIPTGNNHSHPVSTSTTSGFMSASNTNKLNNIQAEATKNLPDATLLARANHTGTQPHTTITGLGNVVTLNTGLNQGQVVLVGPGNKIPDALLPAVDADVAAIAGLTGIGFVRRLGAGSFQIDTSTYALSTHTHTIGQIAGAGSAATYNVGTTSGTIPVLDGSGKVPAELLPALSGRTFLGEVASQSAMLALSGDPGDWCTRTDAPNVGDWTIISGDGSLIGHWRKNSASTAPVTSVNTLTGAVVLTTSEIAEGSRLYYTDARVRANQITQLAGDVPQTRVTNLVADLAGKQAADADLTAIASLGTTGYARRTGANTWTLVNSEFAVVGHTHTTADITNAGTAATRNTGTTNGTVPLIGAGDKLPASVIPSPGGDLEAIEALGGIGYPRRTGTNTWVIDTNTFALAGHTHSASEITGLTTQDPDIIAIAALTGTGYPRRTGDGVWVLDPGTSVAAHTHTLADITNAGTAASRNTGTTNGTIPLIGAGDKLNVNVIPTHTHAIGDVSGLGTAAAKDFGTAAGNLVELDGSGLVSRFRLPAHLKEIAAVPNAAGYLRQGSGGVWGVEATVAVGSLDQSGAVLNDIIRWNGTSWAASNAPAAPMDVTVFSSNGTWTKPATCRRVTFVVVGGGGGGGSGAWHSSTSSAIFGGGGGGAGGAVVVECDGALLPSGNYTVVVGAGGNGGAAGGANSAGNPGLSGGASSVTRAGWATITAVGGAGGAAGGIGSGGAGGAGQANANYVGSRVISSLGGGASVTSGSANGETTAIALPTGGGGGGCRTGAGAFINPGVGGDVAGPMVVTAPAWGATKQIGYYGLGGAGGTAASSGGGVGNVGGTSGGGGGGGGASSAVGTAGGVGGAGGAGRVYVVVEY